MYGILRQIRDSVEASSKEGSHHDQDVQPKRQLRLVRCQAAIFIIACPKVLQNQASC